MNRDTTTGPVFFGRWAARWSTPGLCRPTRSRWRSCCSAPVAVSSSWEPTATETPRTPPGSRPATTSRAVSARPKNPRVYGTFCNCRPEPFPAFAVELRIHTEAHLRAFDPHEPVPGITKAHYTVLALRFFTRVDVGPTTDHMTFTARI